MHMHPVYLHLRFCTFNIKHVHLASHRIFERFLALVGQLGHLGDMKGEKVKKKLFKFFEQLLLLDVLLISSQKQYTINLL